ncbi:hypothetical protein Tsubulata_021410, partial [Turnera subulata]
LDLNTLPPLLSANPCISLLNPHHPTLPLLPFSLKISQSLHSLFCPFHFFSDLLPDLSVTRQFFLKIPRLPLILLPFTCNSSPVVI